MKTTMATPERPQPPCAPPLLQAKFIAARKKLEGSEVNPEISIRLSVKVRVRVRVRGLTGLTLNPKKARGFMGEHRDIYRVKA